MEMRDKLISFPKEVLDVLENWKNKTGVSANDYIRNAVCRKMIEDKLMFIKIKYIYIEEEKNGKKLSVDMEQIEANKFCDGDSCSVGDLAAR